MGLEAECTVRVGRKASSGRALLEGERLVFRGEFRVDIPFDAMREVTTDEDGRVLVVKTSDQETRFELGAPVADRWMRLIKEPKGLFEKLDVGPGSRVAVVDIFDSLFLTALRERTASVAEGRVPEGAPVIFFGAETRDSLRKIQLIRARMIDTGILWIVRPKGSKAISETDVSEALPALGLSETKVVAFSRTHTAHRCVIPEDLRGKAIPRPPIISIPPSAPALAGRASPAKPKPRPSKPPARSGPARPAARASSKKSGARKGSGTASKKKRR
jgi:hypothetical protein